MDNMYKQEWIKCTNKNGSNVRTGIDQMYEEEWIKCTNKKG